MSAVTVETEHSTYHFDTDAQVFTRFPAFADASRLDGDGNSQPYLAIGVWPPRIGQPMFIDLANGKVRTTTPVLRVKTHG